MKSNIDVYCVDCTNAGLESEIGYRPKFRQQEGYGIGLLSDQMVPFCTRSENHYVKRVKG